ncbi:MAG: acetate--CoA ligase family protein, partial [Candidatus Moraniibacteriota bacterium]
CYKALDEIEAEIDLAIIAIPAKFVNQEIQNNAKKIKNYVVISAGFSEIGDEGKKQEEVLAQIARENNLNILGPNCLGFIVPQLRLNASFAGGMPEAGNISFISQSGALAVALMDKAKKEGIKFSNIVSIGNKMQITEAEMLEYLAQDENTKVIGMYLEGIKEGKKFIEIAQRVSRVKPIVILKAGKNEKTQKAISSHTGALAGNDEVVSAVFEKAGVLRADNLEEFFDLVTFISFSREIQNKKVVIITNAGGAGVLISDAFSGKKIQLAILTEETKNKLREFLPEESSVENPIDLLGDAHADRYKNVLEVISKIEEIGSIICLLTPQEQTPVDEIAQEIINFKEKTDKTIAAVFLGGEKVERGIEKLRQNGVCNFSFPDSAVIAVDGYSRWNDFQIERVNIKKRNINEERHRKISEIIKNAKNENRSALYFSESREIMDMYGIKTVEVIEIEAGAELPMLNNFPVVMKVDSDAVLHKTDKQGLILDIKNQADLKTAFDKMRNNFPGAKLIIQPMLAHGTELILGIKKDATFGPVILCGLGGIYTEIFKIAEMFIPPFSEQEISRILQSGKLGFLFRETRGQKTYNLAEINNIILALGDFSSEIDSVLEFDINPLLIYNNKKEAIAVDVKIII